VDSTDRCNILIEATVASTQLREALAGQIGIFVNTRQCHYFVDELSVWHRLAPAKMKTPMSSKLRHCDAHSVNSSAWGGNFRSCSPRCGPVIVAPPARQSGDDAIHLQVVLPRSIVA